jgi:predicted signal transduction protein with EAL and GGDEF domain
VAEGIERVAEWQTLAGLGARVAQGFLVSRAVPAEEMTAMLLSGEPLIETFAVTFGVDPAAECATPAQKAS